MSFRYRDFVVSIWPNEESGKKCHAGSCGESCGRSCVEVSVATQTTCAAPSAQCGGIAYERRTSPDLDLLRQRLRASLPGDAPWQTA